MPANPLNHLNPEIADIAQTTAALAICMTCTIHAGYAEAQQHSLKAFVLVVLALPAAGYIINKPKPRIYRFGETLEDFQPDDLLGSDQPDLTVVPVGCPRREAIETGSFDVVQNVKAVLESDLAVTPNPEPEDTAIPLAASFQPLAATKPGLGHHLPGAGSIFAKLLALAVRNVSTTVGVVLIVVLLIAGVFA